MENDANICMYLCIYIYLDETNIHIKVLHLYLYLSLIFFLIIFQLFVYYYYQYEIYLLLDCQDDDCTTCVVLNFILFSFLFFVDRWWLLDPFTKRLVFPSYIQPIIRNSERRCAHQLASQPAQKKKRLRQREG